MIRAEQINAALGADGWRNILTASGIDEIFLKNKQGPCPACGGKDRFRFDNKKGRGTFYCNQCGAGDGFHLLQRVHGISFIEARDMAARLAGLDSTAYVQPIRPSRPITDDEPAIAQPTRRVRQLLKESCAIEDCAPAIEYLHSRGLWPLPAGHRLRAHPSVEYWHDNRTVGRFPALVTPVRDGDSELVTVHVTYLTQDGAKVSEYEPRKILSPMTGRFGCSAQLMEFTDVLGIAEGIETALSATKLTGIPTWAALNAGMLAKFEVAPEVAKLVIFADRDVAGLEAATKLMQKLQDKVTMEIRIPTANAKDWNDSLRQGEKS